MEKNKIEFLLKNGFTLDEIMKMETPEETKEEDKNTKIEENKDKEATNKEKSFEELLSDFKKELADMRDQIHKDNRTKTAIEPEKEPQLSFEEDIEKMIEEVTK